MRNLSPILKSALNPWYFNHSYIIFHKSRRFRYLQALSAKILLFKGFSSALGFSRTSRSSWRTLDQTCQDRLLLWMTNISLFSFHAQFHFQISSYPFNQHLLYKQFIFIITNFFLNWSSSLICSTKTYHKSLKKQKLYVTMDYFTFVQ